MLANCRAKLCDHVNVNAMNERKTENKTCTQALNIIKENIISASEI